MTCEVMTAMSGLPADSVLQLTEDSVTAAVKDQTSNTETLDVSELNRNIRDVGLAECAASEETDELKQGDRQQDRQTVSPAAESCSSESKWVVGAQCRAVWSEDRQVYPAQVMSVDGERCTVRFHGYGNEEEVELSALRRPDAALQTQTQNCQDWRPGSRCRAVYSEDGLVYPAVILWVKGQRCRVRYDHYDNEEEQEVSDLLSPDELHGPRRAKGSSDWSRRSREENRGGERQSARREEQHGTSWVRESPSPQTKVEKGAEKPTNHSFSFFPPFPPQSNSGGPLSFVPPPPPPPWMFGDSESGGAASSMLMLWYMCGFHTGSYMAQQAFKSSSKH